MAERVARSSVPRARSSDARSRVLWQSVAFGALLVTLVAGLGGFAFAGSAERIPEGVRIAGVEVGGLRPDEARALLERRSAALRQTPVTFFAGSYRWRMTPTHLGVEADWAAAVDSARRQGQGFGPLRGLKRIQVRVFGAEIAPPVKVYEPALEYELRRIGKAVGRPRREAAIVLAGLQPVLVEERVGRLLDREQAAATMVSALAALGRAPVGLPVRVDRPRVDAEALRPALRRARVALSAPVRLRLGETWWRLRRPRIAELLSLPRDGTRTVRVGGPAAARWFGRFAATVGRDPADADFVARGDGSVRLVPAKPGRALDGVRTRGALEAALFAPTRRTARVAVRTIPPELTTTEAKAMGISRILASYSTAYAGTADRIHNLTLAVSMIDGTLVPPGGTFSLNAEVGERTTERGFREAPVIIGGEYKEGVGGGVSQVATTVFNAAWEAGLKIVERAPHSLYISRYPLGRDATVNYPDLDLKFLNDTPRWLRVFGWSGSTGITIALAGAPTNRRVVSEAGPLREVGPVPEKRVADAALALGTTIVEEEGAPPRVVVVTRKVYRADGTLLYDETWQTSYLGEKRIVRVGTKRPEPVPPKPEEGEEEPEPKKPEPKPKPAPGAEPAAPGGAGGDVIPQP